MSRDMEVFVPLMRTKEAGKKKVIIDSGIVWAKVRGGDCLGHRRGLVGGLTIKRYI